MSDPNQTAEGATVKEFLTVHQGCPCGESSTTEGVLELACASTSAVLGLHHGDMIWYKGV
jgi:hypothetical protein